MTSKKKPEQRSTAAEQQPGQAAAQPTGDEVYTPTSEPAAAAEQPEMTEKERAELAQLERAAADAYDELVRAAERLGDRATDAYRSGRTFVKDNPGGTLLSTFVLGVVLGVLISKK